MSVERATTPDEDGSPRAGDSAAPAAPAAAAAAADRASPGEEEEKASAGQPKERKKASFLSPRMSRARKNAQKNSWRLTGMRKMPSFLHSFSPGRGLFSPRGSRRHGSSSYRSSPSPTKPRGPSSDMPSSRSVNTALGSFSASQSPKAMRRTAGSSRQSRARAALSASSDSDSLSSMVRSKSMGVLSTRVLPALDVLDSDSRVSGYTRSQMLRSRSAMAESRNYADHPFFLEMASDFSTLTFFVLSRVKCGWLPEDDVAPPMRRDTARVGFSKVPNTGHIFRCEIHSVVGAETCAMADLRASDVLLLINLFEHLFENDFSVRWDAEGRPAQSSRDDRNSYHASNTTEISCDTLSDSDDGGFAPEVHVDVGRGAVNLSTNSSSE